ncbi:MAG: response regulator [Lysobacteraceae bacterium]|jgi:two-component system cell cycle response regulator
MSYKVALCGLSVKDRHLVDIVLTRAPDPKHRFQSLKPTDSETPLIALVDTGNPVALTGFEELRRRNPRLVGVFISDHGLMGDSRYRIERKALLLQVQRTLDEVVDQELHGNKVSPLSAGAKTGATPTGYAWFGAGDAAFASPPPASLAAAVDVSPLHALVVDDSLAVHEQLRGALDRSGLQSDMAENAEQAIGLLQQRSYDIAFLDVVMPGIDGYELCRKIKQNSYTRAMPVLMLTSRSSPFDRARGALAGCDTYLVKPITWEGFYQALDKSLSKYFRNDREAMARRGYKMSQSR